MPNLSKVAADLKKVNEAVRILNTTTTGINVERAMIMAGFPKTETTNEHLGRVEAAGSRGGGAEGTISRSGGRGRGRLHGQGKVEADVRAEDPKTTISRDDG